MSSASPNYFCPGSPNGRHDLDAAALVPLGRDEGAFPSGVWYQVRCRACGRAGKLLVRDCEYTWEAPEGDR